MKGTKKRGWNSLRFRIFFSCLMVFGFLTLVFLIYGIYNINGYRSDFLMSNSYVLEVYANRYNGEMQMLDRYVNNLFLDNEAFRTLQRTGLSDKNRVAAQYRLKNNLSNKAYSITRYGGLFYYNHLRNELRSCYSEAYSSDDWYYINQEISAWLKKSSGEDMPKEAVVTLLGDPCYLKLYGNGDHCLGFFMNLGKYFENMSELDEETGNQLLIYDEEKHILSSQGLEVLDQEKLERSLDHQWLYRYRYGVSRASLYGCGLELALISYFGEFFRFWSDPRFWIFLVVIPLLGGILSVFLYRFFKNALLFPISCLVRQVHHIEGTEGAEDEHWKDMEEYREISREIDEMLEKIQRLQEETYRKTLEKQAVQMQCYQMQIKPHFYLNCLKEMNALMINEEYEAVGPFIRCLAAYMRARFKSVTDIIPLKEEVTTAYSYYCLMNMSRRDPILFKKEIPKEAEELSVPVFCIQILMENSLKYACREGRILVLQLSAALTEEDGTDCLLLRFSDNGEGYDEKQISEWNSQKVDFSENSEHVGINNLRYRLRLLYGDRAKAVFYNQPSGGAVTELIFPVRTEEGA